MTVNNGMLRRALRASGKPLPGYTLLDQGGGMVQLKSAFAHLRGLAKSAEAQTVLGYRVSTFNPISPDWESPASYWRTGTVQMDRADSIEFHIDPIFPKSVEAATRDQFYQSYKLKSDSPWIDINTSSVYIRGDGGVNVSIRLNPDQLRTPGLHVGRVKAIASGAGNGSSVPAFELVTTVVSPFSFEPHHGYARTWKSKTIGVGDVDRYFLLVPPGATSLALDLDLARSTTGWLRLEVFDPQGRAIRPANRIADTANGGKARVLVSGYTIKPGVWEVDVYSSFRNRNKVRYDLNATFKGLDAPFFTNIEMPQGQSPVIYGTITNLFDQVFHGKGSGEVDGYARRMRLETTGDTFEHPFHIAGDTKKVTFELEMDPLAFARFTDVAINILDGSGKAVVKGGFSQAKTKVVFANPKPGAYTMEIKGAMTNEASKVWSLVIKERFLTHDRVPVTVKHRGSTNLSFYPNVATDLDTYLTRRPKAVPDGYQYAGEIRFVNRKDNRTWLTLPLRLEP